MHTTSTFPRKLWHLFVPAVSILLFAIVANKVLYNIVGVDWYEIVTAYYATWYYSIILAVMLLLVAWAAGFATGPLHAVIIGAIVGCVWVVTLAISSLYTGPTLGLATERYITNELLYAASAYATIAATVSSIIYYAERHRKRRWRLRRHRCWTCGYILSRSSSDVCPECGLSVPDRCVEHRRSRKVFRVSKLQAVAIAAVLILPLYVIGSIVIAGVMHRIYIMDAMHYFRAEGSVEPGTIVWRTTGAPDSTSVHYIDGVTFYICGDGGGGVAITVPRDYERIAQVHTIRCSEKGVFHPTQPTLVVTYQWEDGGRWAHADRIDPSEIECLIAMAAKYELSLGNAPFESVFWLEDGSDPCARQDNGGLTF